MSNESRHLQSRSQTFRAKIRLRFISGSLLALSACEREERAMIAPPQIPVQSAENATTLTPTTPDKAPLVPIAEQLDIPPDYEGPIDPQWPPTHAADLEVELKAARIIRRALKRGERPPREQLLDGDTNGVYADEGRIGGFDYIEVVLGPMAHPDEVMPLLILLHGRGGRPTIPKGPYLTTRPIRVFIPRGPDPLQGGFNWLATWTNSGKYELLSRSLVGRVDQLMPAIEAYAKLRPTEGKPIVAGFSQGGILSYALAIRYPAQFEAVFPIAGWLPPGLLPTAKMPGVKYPFIHAFHGGSDTVVPTEKGRASVQALRKAGIAIEYSEFPGVGHEVTPEINQSVRLAMRRFLDANPTD